MQEKIGEVRISVAVLAYNEEHNLPGLFDTLGFADEVVLFDAESSDSTAQIARDFGAILISGPNDRNLNVNKTIAIEKCMGDWIIYLDADERITPELGVEIRDVVERQRIIKGESARYNAFTMPRLNNYFGRYLRYGGAYPDTQLRLFKRGKAYFECLSVHEKLVVEGQIGKLKSVLHHESYPTVVAYLNKFPFYIAANADFYERKKLKTCVGTRIKYLVLKPFFKVFRKFVLRGGFRDCWQGYVAAVLDGVQMILSYGEYLQRRKAEE